MKSKPPSYLQETASSCVPACLRMVLAVFGVVVSESKLRQLCDCTIFGTNAFQAVEAARQLGFEKTHKANLSMSQLDDLVTQGLYLIVYVWMRPIANIAETHALVVVEISQNNVTVLDPAMGERQLQYSVFESAFMSTNGLTIVVK